MKESKSRLLSALQHIHAVSELMIDNNRKDFLSHHINSIELELDRQLYNIISDERTAIQRRNQQHLNDAKQQRPELPDFTSTD
tara:strand:- start:265 stop:513 length:249 start_codon:yes stop_codon:yes gene_type:complete